MLLGVIADDFTGASDVGNTLARGGMATRLFVGMDGDAAGCDAGVVALKSRSIPAADAVSQSLAALEWLRAAGCGQVLFKYCSTFDSTADGNIGPVALALAGALSARGVVVCPAFPGAGRTIYQGHLFVGDRLLSESGMERHPLTPMTDPNIRRWLAAQTGSAPGHVPQTVVRGGRDAIRSALAEYDGLVVVDATSDDDLLEIGAAAAGASLVTGGSGIAIGLAANFADRVGVDTAGFMAARGPVAVLSGSCSVATRAQVAHHKARHPSHEVDVEALLAGGDEAGRALAFLRANAGSVPLVYSSADPEVVRDVQARHGAERAAAAVETLFGEVAVRAAGHGFSRIVACGGETSGAVVAALGVPALAVGPEIDPGVPALSAELAGAPLTLALKSGNFGGVDFMERAAGVLGAEA